MTTMTQARSDILGRFWSYVDQHGPPALLRPELGHCWIWTGALLKSGYGQFSLSWRPTRIVVAHRFLWEITNATPVPPGLELDHFACERRSCCNAAHVRPVTRRENLLRGETVPTTINLAKRRCPSGHPYSHENTYVRPTTGHRQCRACKRDQNRRADQRRRDQKGYVR